MQLIRASIAFGLYVKKSSPELKSKVQNAMAAFLNRRVGSWIAENGGWVSVFILESHASWIISLEFQDQFSRNHLSVDLNYVKV